MDISTIKQKIAALEAEIVPNSVSPERVASILSDITSLVENIGYLGYEFLGVATPAASPSFDKDLTSKKYFYIAVQQGTYTNFGGLTVGANDGLTILAYNGTWTKMATGTAMKADIKDVLRTGDVRNSLLGEETDKPVSVALVKLLYSNGYTFMGIADTNTSPYSNPEVVGLKLFYIAVEKGTYMKFGNKEKKSAASLMVLMSSDSGKTWASEESADLSADISDLAARVSIGKAPVWISVEADTVGDVSTYDVGTVIWRKDRNTLVEVVQSTTGGKEAGADHSIEADRIYVYGGNLCKWDGTKFVPFYQEEKEKRYLFSLDSIDSLTTATDSETVYQSFIPAGETVYKLPTTGDLLGDEENNIYADILYAHYTEAMDEGGITLSYYKDGVVKTIRITGDDYEWGTWKVAEVTTVKLKYKYNLQKIFALSSSSESEDIEEAFTPTYAPDGNTAMRLPQSGDLLEATNGATSVVLKGTSKAFSFFYGDNRRDITLSGSAGNYKVAVVVTPLDVRVFDLDKLNALTDESTPEDIEEAFGGNYPTVGDLLSGADESSWVMMSGSEQSTLGHTFTYHTGGKLRTLTVSGGQGHETIKVEEKEVGSGIVRLAGNIGTISSVDLGYSYNELVDMVSGGNSPLFIDKNNNLYTATYTLSVELSFLRVSTLTQYNGSYYWGEPAKVYKVTDAGSDKVAIAENPNPFKIPYLDSNGKIPTALLPEQEPHVEFSLQLHNGDLLVICKEGEILPSDEIHFYRRGRYSTHLHSDIGSNYRNRKEGWRTSNNYSGFIDPDQGYETYIPYQFGKEKLEQGVNGNPKLVGMDVWKLTALEDQSGFADSFPALFRSAMVRLDADPNVPRDWYVCIRDGRKGKSYGWYDYQKFAPSIYMEIRKTVQAGVAVHRNIRRISDIVPFKIRFHLVNDGTLSDEVPPTIDGNYVRVTLRI